MEEIERHHVVTPGLLLSRYAIYVQTQQVKTRQPDSKTSAKRQEEEDEEEDLLEDQVSDTLP